jgi:hypothetical protein
MCPHKKEVFRPPRWTINFKLKAWHINILQFLKRLRLSLSLSLYIPPPPLLTMLQFTPTLSPQYERVCQGRVTNQIFLSKTALRFYVCPNTSWNFLSKVKLKSNSTQYNWSSSRWSTIIVKKVQNFHTSYVCTVLAETTIYSNWFCVCEHYWCRW